LYLSILILTHNRPKLFKRCINSVLLNKPDNVEIIVNNDSNDITEIPGATYYYKKYEDISKIYKFLYIKANGKYIYYLEDDDYVVKNFYKIINIDNLKNTCYRYMPLNNIKLYYSYWKNLNNFREHFQLGQIIFNKNDIKKFPCGNNLSNDYELYKQINFKYSKIPIFVQTDDGKDNISFPKYNTDKRFKGNGCELY